MLLAATIVSAMPLPTQMGLTTSAVRTPVASDSMCNATMVLTTLVADAIGSNNADNAVRILTTQTTLVIRVLTTLVVNPIWVISTLPSEEGKVRKVKWLELMLESGLDCLICAMFVRQR